MSASHTLARGRKTQNWLAIALVASGLTNIAVPVYFWSTSHVRDQVVVFDLASGSLLLSPMVDQQGASLPPDGFRVPVRFQPHRQEMKLLILSLLLGATSLFADDNSMRVREEILDQHSPVTVNVSTHGLTTLQFADRIEALDGDSFTAKPGEEAGDFAFSPGINWVSIKALRPGTEQNLNVILRGKVFSIVVHTTEMNDFTVIFRYPQGLAAK
jgi:hypothetical protein